MSVRDPRSILITGASSGIGAALAGVYAGPGIHLALAGRNAERLAAVATLCRERGATVTEGCVDVTEAAAVADWVERAERTAPLDLLIANAGIQGGLSRDGAGETLAEIHRVMAVNFGGVCNTVHAALPAMRARQAGQIALVASLAALRGFPSSPGYCASKAAVTVYGEALRAWLASERIDVSIVLPGFVETRLSDTLRGPKPLMLSPARAAGIIRRRLRKGYPVVAFPYQLYLAARVMQALPRRLTDPLLRLVPIEIIPYR